MNENLNLGEILKDCPTGTRLYSPLLGDVILTNACSSLNKHYPIAVQGAKTQTCIQFTTEGCFLFGEDGECLLFPSKDQRDWGKFNAPMKKFNPKTFQPFDRVLIRDHCDELWEPAFFGNINEKLDFPCRNVGGISLCCIPYNDETKHLLGTTEDCPEYYKWWE